MNDPVVVIQNLSKTFGKDTVPALEGISATIPKGQIIGLVGPDGAGKTTLIRLIAGLLKPTTGTITVAGYDTIQNPEEIHAMIGYMPQKFGLYEDLTVQQNLNLYADLRGLPDSERKQVFSELLAFTTLAPFTKRLAKDLSGGMKQKLGLACTLIRKPTFMLLDEPSVGVDPISRRELWSMVHALLKEGISVVWSTSYLDEAEKCDTVLLLDGGKLLFHGPPNKLTERIAGNARFEDAYIDILGGGPSGPSPLAEKTPYVTSKEQIVIKTEGLTKRFGNFTAADDMTFEIPRGEIFGLLGPNGAGKSTTFKMMCGLLKPTSGRAFVNGLDLQVAPGEARSHIGYMAQKFSLYGNLSVRQNLNFFSGIYNLSGKQQNAIIDEMVDIFNLKSYLDENADTLPLGYKQRLALSCAVMHHPEVLFLDEPTSGVDPITRIEFWNHINGMVKKGVTVMITTHFMDEAENCDRIALVYRSKVINMGTPTALKLIAKTADNPTPTLEDAFIELIRQYDRENNVARL